MWKLKPNIIDTQMIQKTKKEKSSELAVLAF